MMKFLTIATCVTAGFACHVPAAEVSPEQSEFFETRIRPVLAEQCHRCHSHEAKKLKAGLFLDSRGGLVAGGESGAAIVPGDPEASLLIEALRYQNPDMQMPPKKMLPPQVIADFEKWVAMSAPWPGSDSETAPAAKAEFDLEKRKREHWAWQLVKAATPPDVRDIAWPAQPLDRFVLASLEAMGLQPNPPADRRTLIRRASFDLTGLPPTPEETAAFVNDPRPEGEAFAAVVDRLLASPHFGERWARHWMDMMRYADSCGHEFDYPIPHAWRYRDYLIRAFNADVPYNWFVAEHIAGDLLPAPRRNPEEGFNESVIATGSWYLGEAVHAPTDVRGDESDRVNNQIDTMTKAFLGVTVACARCHDHKFDAISTKDYYALAGYLQSSRREVALLDPQGKIAATVEKLRALKQEGDRKIASPPPPHAPASGDSAVRFVRFAEGAKGWFPSGQAWTSSPTGDREWDPTRADGAAANPGVMHSGLLSPKLRGTLRSPTFEITHEKIFYHVNARGGGIRIKLVIDSHFMTDYHDLLFKGTHLKNVDTKEQWQWLTAGGDVKKYIGHKAHIELVDEGDGFLAVDEIWFGNAGAPKGGAERPPAGDAAAFADLSAQIAELGNQLPAPMEVIAMTDGTAENEHVFLRGSHRKLGEEVPRRFLTALGGEDVTPPAQGSGRAALAKQMTDPDNPLVSRVIVNRLWHHTFGRGIVPTTDDFGVLGQPPSHPELLDFLAAEFVRDGWSVKGALRQLMLSSTYRMSSDAVGPAEAADPENVWLHRANVRRLEGEAIRDQILSVSGRLDRTLCGPPVPVHLTSFMTGRGRPGSGPLDGNGRRSLYTNVLRNFLSPMMLAFDTPIPFTSIGRRTVSTVPAQALILMNDPFVVQQADVWSQRVMKEKPTTDERIAAMYESAFCRPPSEAELEQGRAFVGDGSPAQWKDYAHVLMNTKEFVFLR